MTSASPGGVPPDAREQARQEAVEALGLRGTAQPRLDRIVRLAQAYFGVDGVAVTVLDRDRAYWPASVGWDGSGEGARQDTFCNRTTALGDLLVVEDALTDHHLSHLVPVTGYRFYAGAPLRDRDGHLVAVLCVMDPEPRQLSPDERATFLDLATWAEQEVLSSTEMTQAGRVQASMLPQAGIRRDGWDVDGLCVPASSVGGDFYDFGLSNGVVHVVLGDVMGKGTGAALLGAGIRSAVRGTLDAVSAGVDLGVTVTRIGAGQLPDLERTSSFATLFEAAVDTSDGRLRYVDAGSGLAVIVRADGSVEQLRSDDRPLGVLPEDYWTEHERQLHVGDRLVVVSDGVLDLLEDDQAWADELAGLARTYQGVRELLTVMAGLTRTGNPSDDVTAVVVARTDGGRAA